MRVSFSWQAVTDCCIKSALRRGVETWHKSSSPACLILRIPSAPAIRRQALAPWISSSQGRNPQNYVVSTKARESKRRRDQRLQLVFRRGVDLSTRASNLLGIWNAERDPGIPLRRPLQLFADAVEHSVDEVHRLRTGIFSGDFQ